MEDRFHGTKKYLPFLRTHAPCAQDIPEINVKDYEFVETYSFEGYEGALMYNSEEVSEVEWVSVPEVRFVSGYSLKSFFDDESSLAGYTKKSSRPVLTWHLKPTQGKDLNPECAIFVTIACINILHGGPSCNPTKNISVICICTSTAHPKVYYRDIRAGVSCPNLPRKNAIPRYPRHP